MMERERPGLFGMGSKDARPPWAAAEIGRLFKPRENFGRETCLQIVARRVCHFRIVR